ncbi:MAG TPA: hypothetical protein VFZ84_20275 [Burkholderiales bacterium]
MKTAIVVLALALAACTEHPQRLASAHEPGYRTDAWPDQHRARTLRQGEAGRIYH